MSPWRTILPLLGLLAGGLLATYAIAVILKAMETVKW